MPDIKEVLVFYSYWKHPIRKVREMYQEHGFSKLSMEDLHGLRDYLDLLSDEIYHMKRKVMKELDKKSPG